MKQRASYLASLALIAGATGSAHALTAAELQRLLAPAGPDTDGSHTGHRVPRTVPAWP